MKLFILLIGLILVFEGLPYAAAPEKMKDWLKKLSEINPIQMRTMGVIVMISGLVICFIVQKTTLIS